MAKFEILDAKRSVLVVIDYQGKLMEMIERPELTIAAAKRILKLAGVFEVPIILTEQYPQGLGVTHPEIRAVYDELEADKQYVEKVSFGCCGEAAFMEALDKAFGDTPVADRQVVIIGIEAHVCVMQTVLELLREGYSVHACWEAISCRGKEYYKNALQRMQQAGAVLTNHESLGFEWARDSNHEGFRALNRLLREGQLT